MASGSHQQSMQARRLTPELDALRYKVLGAAYRVHSALGPSMRESVYRRCFVHALERDGLLVESEVRYDVEFEGLVLEGVVRLDLVVEDQIVIEIKAADHPAPVWGSQVLSYLWHTGHPIGYLINFHVTHLRQGIRPYYHGNEDAMADSASSS